MVELAWLGFVLYNIHILLDREHFHIPRILFDSSYTQTVMTSCSLNLFPRSFFLLVCCCCWNTLLRLPLLIFIFSYLQIKTRTLIGRHAKRVVWFYVTLIYARIVRIVTKFVTYITSCLFLWLWC